MNPQDVECEMWQIARDDCYKRCKRVGLEEKKMVMSPPMINSLNLMQGKRRKEIQWATEWPRQPSG